MKKSIREKIISTSGASMIIALIFFALTVMAATVIMTAATANAGRLTSLKKEEQAYLAVSSAAKLVRSAVEGQSYTIMTYSVSGECGSDIAPPTAYEYPSGVFGNLLKELFESAPESRTLTINADGLENVEAVFNMAADGGLEIVFSMSDPLAENYTMTLKIDAESETEQNFSSGSHTYTTYDPYDPTTPVENVCHYTVTENVAKTTWVNGIFEKGDTA